MGHQSWQVSSSPTISSTYHRLPPAPAVASVHLHGCSSPTGTDHDDSRRRYRVKFTNKNNFPDEKKIPVAIVQNLRVDE
jgi:hypothetical protein